MSRHFVSYRVYHIVSLHGISYRTVSSYPVYSCCVVLSRSLYRDAISYHIMLRIVSRSMSYRAHPYIAYRIVPFRITFSDVFVLCRTISPYYITLYRRSVVSYCTTSYRFHIVSYDTVSFNHVLYCATYHILSYRTIS